MNRPTLWASCSALAILVSLARAVLSAQQPSDSAPVVTDAMMGEYARIRASISEEAAPAVRSALAQKSTLGSAALNYIERQIGLIQQQAMDARQDREKVANRQSQMIRPFFARTLDLDAMMSRLPPDSAKAMREQMAKNPLIAERMAKQQKDALAKFDQAAGPPTTPTSNLVWQNTAGLFDSDLDIANRKVIEPWLTKMGIYLGLHDNEQQWVLTLRNGDANTRRQALRDLERAKAYPAIPAIIALLSDPQLAEEAGSSLGSFRDDIASAAPAIVLATSEALSHSNGAPDHPPRFALRVEDVLRQIGAASVAPLQEALSADSPLIRAWAAAALGRMFRPVAQLVAQKRDELPVELQEEAAALDAAAPHLLPLLQDPVPQVRAVGAEAVSESPLPAQQSVPLIAPLLKDSNAATRIAAISALGRIGPNAAPAVQDLLAFLGDSDRVASTAAAGALAQLGLSGMNALASRYAPDDPRELKVLILGSLSQSRVAGPDAAQLRMRLMAAATQDSDHTVRILGLKLAENSYASAPETKPRKIAGLNVVPESTADPGAKRPSPVSSQPTTNAADVSESDQALLRSLQSSDFAEQASAISGLGALSPAGKSRAVPMVHAMLNSADLNRRTMGCLAVRKLGHDAKPLTPDLVALAQSRDKRAQTMALAVLGGMGADAAEALPALVRLHDDSSDPAIKSLSQQIIQLIQRGQDD